MPSAFAKPPPLTSFLSHIQSSFSQIVLAAPLTQYIPLPFALQLHQPCQPAFGVLLKLKADSELALWTNPAKSKSRAGVVTL